MVGGVICDYTVATVAEIADDKRESECVCVCVCACVCKWRKIIQQNCMGIDGA